MTPTWWLILVLMNTPAVPFFSEEACRAALVEVRQHVNRNYREAVVCVPTGAR